MKKRIMKILRKKIISYFSTKELHDELITRGGVETFILEPYETKKIEVEGPATLFIVID